MMIMDEKPMAIVVGDEKKNIMNLGSSNNIRNLNEIERYWNDYREQTHHLNWS